jgi:hypothetical protein
MREANSIALRILSCQRHLCCAVLHALSDMPSGHVACVLSCDRVLALERVPVCD